MKSSVINTVIVLLCVPIQQVSALDSKAILQHLGQGEFTQLELKYDLCNEAQKLFLDAVFETEGNKAAILYEKIWNDYPVEILAWEALNRLYEYYIATGDYKQAEGLKKQLVQRPSDTLVPYDEKSSSGAYWVQTGAYSNTNNAVNQKKRLLEKGYNAIIITKTVSGKKLNIVRAGGFTSENEAKMATKEIERLLKIKTRVVKEE